MCGCVCVGHVARRKARGAALRQLVAPHGWDNPAGRVGTPASPVLLLEGAGRVARTPWSPSPPPPRLLRPSAWARAGGRLRRARVAGAASGCTRRGPPPARAPPPPASCAAPSARSPPAVTSQSPRPVLRQFHTTGCKPTIEIACGFFLPTVATPRTAARASLSRRNESLSLSAYPHKQGHHRPGTPISINTHTPRAPAP